MSADKHPGERPFWAGSLPATGFCVGARMRSRVHGIMDGHHPPDADGLLYIVNSAAAYLAAVPHILQHMATITGTHSFHVKNLGLQPGQRLKVSRLKN
jgi:hypothetical protein